MGARHHRLVGPTWQGEAVSEDEASAVQAVYAALSDRDWAALRLLLHPYLHWTGAGGRPVRGRTRVLALLGEGFEPPPTPTSVELRDGQIYRWQIE